MREQVWKYSPDVVLLAITTNNDFIDNSSILKKTRDVPFFVYRDGKLIVVDNSFRETPEFQWRRSRTGRFGRWLRDHFRVVQAAIEGHRALRLKWSGWRSQRPPKVLRFRNHPTTNWPGEFGRSGNG